MQEERTAAAQGDQTADAGETQPAANSPDNKKYLTLAEYIFSALATGSDGLKGALSVWGGMVNTIFLKLKPQSYVNLAKVGTAMSVFMQVYNLFAARISDRMTNHKRTVYTLAVPAAVLGILGSVPIAFFFPSMSDAGKIAYVSTLGVIGSIIGPYLANAQSILGIRMTPSSRERGILGTINNTIGSGAGSLTGPVMSLVILLFGSIVPYEKGSNSANAYFYFYGNILFTAVAVTVALVFNAVRQVRIPAPEKSAEGPAGGLKEFFASFLSVGKAIVKNKPLVLKKVSGMLGAWAGLSGSAYSLIVTKYYQGITIHFPGGHSYQPSLGMLFFIFSLTQTIPSLISLSLTPALRKRFSDKKLVIFQMLWYLAGSLVSFVSLSGLFFQLPRQRRYWIQMFCYHWDGWMFGLNVCGNVMDLELLDYSEWQTGERNECTFGYITGLAHWLFTLPIGIIAARLLIRTGYRTDRPDDPITPLITQNLFRLFTIAPLAGKVLTLIPMFFYDFTGKKREMIMQQLLERRELRLKAIAETEASAGREES
ncbi:MAG TPA: MFS transporter [Clostridiales bacterium]|nr:MAG: hypothetical protein BWY37_00945 [Firmicutes bacterium ADurb.Bin262]HQK72181.1 MFS transporter [Clostridiales bacterium]